MIFCCLSSCGLMMVTSKTYKLNYALILLLLMQWPYQIRDEVKHPLRSQSVSSSRNRESMEAGPLNLQRSLSVDTLRHNNDESHSYGSTSPSRGLSDVTLKAWTGENANRNELNVFSPKRSSASSSTLINPSVSTIPKCSSNGSRSVVACAKASLVVYIYVCVC